MPDKVIDADKLDRILGADHSKPKTFRAIISVMLSSGYKPLELSEVIGPSGTVIEGWGKGERVPPSTEWRKFAVGELIKLIETNQPIRKKENPTARIIPFKKIEEPPFK